MRKVIVAVLVMLLWCNVSLSVETLGEQLVKLESLYKRGTITEKEFTKAKAILLKMDSDSSIKIKQAKVKVKDLSSSRKKELKKIELNTSDKKYDEVAIRKFRANTREDYEKMEIIFNDYRFYTFRPGAIKVEKRSNGKKLAILSGNFKVKYYNGGEDVFKFISHEANSSKKEEYKIKALNELQKYSDKVSGVFGKGLTALEEGIGIKRRKLPGRIEIKFNGVPVLNWERIYVKKHRANFYQMSGLTDRDPFHFYVVTGKGNSAALNMERFGKKIDIAIEKAKKKLAKQHNLTIEEVEYILERKKKKDNQRLAGAVRDVTEQAVSEEVQKQVTAEVDNELAKELEKTIGEEAAKEMMAAIEVSTGREIDAVMESQVASLIDDAVAAAIEEGYSQAAVEAGLEAYMETLAAGGTDAEAVAAADAAGCAADANACD